MSAASLEAAVRLERRVNGAAPFVLDATIDVAPGFTILFGASGSGKSTLLDCVAGLVRPDAGRISIGDTILFDSKQAFCLSPQQRGVGYVFQSLALFPHLTVEQNVEYGLARIHRGERAAQTREILKRFRLEGLAQQKPGAISGGEKQRVALARSLVTQPRALLLDEPLSGLDAELRRIIVEDLRAWNAARPIPIVYVTHSRDEAESLGVRIVALEAGKVMREGLPSDVLDAPRRHRLAQIAGFENVLEGTVRELHEADGTMRVRLESGNCEIEVPLAHAAAGERVRIAIRAGDILLATEAPQKLSARNVLAGRIRSLEERVGLFAAHVDCGAEFTVHVTRGAVRELRLAAEKPVWLVLKTHSCHLVTP
jgi:molybdate transport system ATP-binding protein